jgi:beta-lactamase class A
MLMGYSISAQNQPEQVLQSLAGRIKSMLEQFRENDYKSFADGFYQEVSKDQLRDGFKANYELLGGIARHRVCRLVAPGVGELEYIGTNGRRLRVNVRFEAAPPHRINYLLFGKVFLDKDSWEALTLDIQKLPGQKSATVWKIAPEQSTLFSLNSKEPLAVGSSFKLLVLSLLCDEIATGKRQWKDVVTLQEEGRSLPSGLLQDWPISSPITLHTLATMMISRSDNTAVDHLLLTSGREAIEKHQSTCKIQSPQKNIPFLRTSELFKLKLIWSPEQASRYVQADAAARRAMLPQLAKARLTDPRVGPTPNAIDRIEWFFSTDDLSRVMMKMHESDEAERALAILGIAKPFDIDDYAWEYLGFKGGAEIGVLNLSLVGKLRGKPEWYAFSFTWNDTKQALDEAAWLRLVERALQLVEGGK